jgi:hypothetical protein
MEERYTYWVLVGKPEERVHLEDLGIDGIIKLKMILNGMGGCGRG